MIPLPSPASTLLCAEDPADWSRTPSSSTRQESIPPAHHGYFPISDLLAAELVHRPPSDYHSRLCGHSVDLSSRRDAISWILKVHGFYCFRPVTAYLAVNYMDRFLYVHKLPGDGGWPWQLLSVACLSVAAKMEETHVPLLLDLQVMEPPFLFDPCTVRRMELFLMASLRWRLRAVTPFDFLGHYSTGGGAPFASVVSRASDIVLDTLDVVDFSKYSPSAISAAAFLSAAEEIADFSTNCARSSIHELVKNNKEMVDDCLRLMHLRRGGKRERATERPIPQSPVGVLDAAACGSCDSQKAPPSSKRRRVAPVRSDTEGVGDGGGQ